MTGTSPSDFTKRLDKTADDTEALLGRLLAEHGSELPVGVDAGARAAAMADEEQGRTVVGHVVASRTRQPDDHILDDFEIRSREPCDLSGPIGVAMCSAAWNSIRCVEPVALLSKNEPVART